MNLDTEIRRAIERLNRSIGQKARYAHADLRRMAEEHRAWADSLRSPRERARDLRNDMLLGLEFYLRRAPVDPVDVFIPSSSARWDLYL